MKTHGLLVLNYVHDVVVKNISHRIKNTQLLVITYHNFNLASFSGLNFSASRSDEIFIYVFHYTQNKTILTSTFRPFCILSANIIASVGKQGFREIIAQMSNSSLKMLVYNINLSSWRTSLLGMTCLSGTHSTLKCLERQYLLVKNN